MFLQHSASVGQIAQRLSGSDSTAPQWVRESGSGCRCVSELSACVLAGQFMCHARVSQSVSQSQRHRVKQRQTESERVSEQVSGRVSECEKQILERDPAELGVMVAESLFGQ